MGVATGDFLQFLDADDLLGPKKIATQLCALENAPPNSVATSGWSFFTNANFEPASPRDFWQSYDDALYLLIDMWRSFGFFPCHSYLLPRTLLADVGYWDEALSRDDDGEYFGRVLASANSVVFTADVLAYYRKPSVGHLSCRFSTAASKSVWRANKMTEKQILSRCSNQRAFEAVFSRWIGLAYQFAGYDKNLMRLAVARTEKLPRSARHSAAVGGSLFQILSKCIGFRYALEVRSWLAG